MDIVPGMDNESYFYLSGLNSSLGLSYLDEWTVGTARYSVGGIFGVRAGCLVAMGIMRYINGPYCLHIMVRHTPITPPAAEKLKSAIKAIPGFRSFMKLKSLTIADDLVNIYWALPHLGAKPAAEEVTNMLDLVLQEIRCYAGAFDDKCEDCRAVPAPQIILLDGIPGHHCISCQKAMMLRKEAEAAEYDARKGDYPRATRVGVCIALFMGAFWGISQHMLVALNSDVFVKTAVIGSMVTGGAVFWGVFKIVGKKESRGLKLAAILTVASRLGASVISWSDLLIHSQPVPTNWVEMVVASIAADLLFIGVLCLVRWTKPRPTITFQPVTVGGYNASACPTDRVTA